MTRTGLALEQTLGFHLQLHSTEQKSRGQAGTRSALKASSSLTGCAHSLNLLVYPTGTATTSQDCSQLPQVAVCNALGTATGNRKPSVLLPTEHDNTMARSRPGGEGTFLDGYS